MARILTGTVVSNKMKNTAVVAVNRIVADPLYGKKLRRTSRFSVDTNNTTVNIGDTVRIEETRKVSKTKHFKILGKEEAKS